MSDDTAPFSRLKNWPADRHGVDVHGTDHAKLPQVLGVGRTAGADCCEATVFLNFVPSFDQMLSLREHLRSWTPPDA